MHAVGHHDPFGNAGVMARGIVGSMGEAERHRDTVASPMYKQDGHVEDGDVEVLPGLDADPGATS